MTRAEFYKLLETQLGENSADAITHAKNLFHDADAEAKRHRETSEFTAKERDSLKAKADELNGIIEKSKGENPIELSKVQTQLDAITAKLESAEKEKIELVEKSRVNDLRMKVLPMVDEKFYSGSLAIDKAIASGILTTDEKGNPVIAFNEKVFDIKDGLHVFAEIGATPKQALQAGPSKIPMSSPQSAGKKQLTRAEFEAIPHDQRMEVLKTSEII